MILSILVSFIISQIIIGYSFIFKKLIYLKKKRTIIIKNEDFIYGVFFLTFISILSNFFFPLFKITIITIFIGFFFFVFCVVKKIIKLNFFYLFLIISFFVFISHNQGINYDAQYYHLQIIKLNTEYKSIFGIINLEDRYGMNSSLHSLISLFNLSIYGYNTIYLFSIILLSFVINQFFSTNKNLKKSSSIFLSFSLFFIFIYSFFHPFGNGTILNNIGSPEVDITAAFFFIYTFYLFLKYDENKEENLINLIILISILIFTIKINYLAILIIPFLILILNKKILSYLQISLYSVFFLIIWSIKGFISSGCFLFPIPASCFNTSWSLPLDKIENYQNIIMSFARDTPDRQKFSDFDHTLNSYDWFYPWINEYFLKTEFLFISFLLIVFFVTSLIFLFIFKKKINISKNYLWLLLVSIVGLIIWFKAPEIRFGYGTIISLVSILFTILFTIFRPIKFKDLFLFIVVLIPIFLLIYKNFENYSSYDLIFTRNFDHKNWKLIQHEKGIKIYTPPNNVFCSDFPDFCTYKKNKSFIIKKDNYLYFMNKS